MNTKEPVVYVQAATAFGKNGFGEIKLPRTGDTAHRNDHTGRWEHHFANGEEMPADQWWARAWDQIGA